jgi:thiamine pyrophosphate-dependent acetolactate synthase large subunit-like protein
MALLTGNDILARCLKAQGVKDMFFLMGGPMLDAETACINEGIRLIDTRPSRAPLIWRRPIHA